MKLNVISDGNRTRKPIKSTTIKEVDVLDVFRDIDPNIKEGVEICLSEEGKKQESRLVHPYYIVEEVYIANLGDMRAWMLRLKKTDKKVMNPYLANHFKIYKKDGS